MKIQLTPQRSDMALAVFVDGDTLTVNGKSFNFEQIHSGESLPASAIASDLFSGDVRRVDGELHVTLALPYGVAPQIDPMQVVDVHATSGPVAVPGHISEQAIDLTVGTIDWGQLASPREPATQFELDQSRYKRRAGAYAELMSWMSADNVSRVRSGVWTLPDLKSLMADPAVTAAQAYMSMLSYELAAKSIQEATTPLLTPEIKAAWVAQLQAHF